MTLLLLVAVALPVAFTAAGVLLARLVEHLIDDLGGCPCHPE